MVLRFTDYPVSDQRFEHLAVFQPRGSPKTEPEGIFLFFSRIDALLKKLDEIYPEKNKDKTKPTTPDN